MYFCLDLFHSKNKNLFSVQFVYFFEFLKLEILGSLFWMAPEILTHQDSSPYTVSSDMYAYGIVLFELFAGELPYFDIPFLQPGMSQFLLKFIS